jgi:putative heme iron utilization protein
MVADARVSKAAVPPSTAETARTSMELVGSGTLSTLDASGTPLGTFASYVLDAEGLPLLRLRRAAVHTQNLRANAACSLFVHAPLQPVRAVARVTLIGTAEEITGEEKEAAQLKHAAANSDAIGVDAPRDDDVFMRLNPVRAFYVGGLGTVRKRNESLELRSALLLL